MLASLPGTYKEAQHAAAWEEQEGVAAATLQPYMADLFYEGKNDGSEAHLRLRMRQYIDVFRVSRPGDLLGVFSAIGGFAASWASAVGIMLALYESCCAQGEAAEARAKRRHVQALEGVGLLAPRTGGDTASPVKVGGSAADVRAQMANGAFFKSGLAAEVRRDGDARAVAARA